MAAPYVRLCHNVPMTTPPIDFQMPRKTLNTRELAVIEGIHRGLADMEAGRVVLHEDAMRHIQATIDRAQKGLLITGR